LQSIRNYEYIYRNLAEFCEKKNFHLRVSVIKGNNQKQLQAERNYWKKFYKSYTDYLYSERGCYDNYVGTNIKVIKTFMKYLSQERNIPVGDFYKVMHVPNEEVPIITLSSEQLKFLVNDKAFEDSLPEHLQVTKDIFVFGCTVALRASDIFRLSPGNVQTANGKHYLAVKTQKTGAQMRIKLPDYAHAILMKYTGGKKQKVIFPAISLSQFNKNLKRIAALAEWTYEVGKVREQYGLNKKVYLPNQTRKEYRFCDLVTSHTMRRTAITTMLTHGMPEHLVKLISGHAGNSKAFYRYVNYVQSFADAELDRVHEKIGGI
jgi:integrase